MCKAKLTNLSPSALAIPGVAGLPETISPLRESAWRAPDERRDGARKDVKRLGDVADAG